jgi:hypothetical protein
MFLATVIPTSGILLERFGQEMGRVSLEQGKYFGRYSHLLTQIIETISLRKRSFPCCENIFSKPSNAIMQIGNLSWV